MEDKILLMLMSVHKKRTFELEEHLEFGSKTIRGPLLSKTKLVLWIEKQVVQMKTGTIPDLLGVDSRRESRHSLN